jgi:tetratricopeptide (TPR) repeat protein
VDIVKNFLTRRPVRLIPIVILGILAANISASLKAQAPADASGVSVEANQQIFTIMCALDAAGFDAAQSTIAEMPARIALREELLKMQGPAIDAVRQFYRDNAFNDPAETLSRYITLALNVGPPPDFAYQVEHEQLPPDVLSIENFQKLLPEFYSEARLDARWAAVAPEYEPGVEHYTAALRHIALTVNAYLREVEKPSNGRTFSVYYEPLVGSRTNFRNFGYHYAIVVGTHPDSHLDAIQHAYLHFMLDPLALHYRPAIDTKRAILPIAAAAPRLPVEYHDDLLAFTDECVIKAVELRLRHLPPAQLEAALEDADASGYVLVRPFVAQLQKFEKDEPAMTYYFPTMITSIDVDAEQKRLQSVKFAPAGSQPAPLHGETADSNQPSDLDGLIDQGNRDIARRDAAAATATFEKALVKYPNDPRAMYGLAISSVLSGKADRARDIFEKIVSNADSSSMDPSVLSWSHVYLGRMHDLEDERDLAVKEYRAALGVAGAPENARAAAQSGVEAAYQAPQRPDAAKQSQP